MTTYFNLVDGKPTLWDSPAEDRVPLVVVGFKDGSTGLLPADKHLALARALDLFDDDGGKYGNLFSIDPNDRPTVNEFCTEVEKLELD
jgi:hypothetical protein